MATIKIDGSRAQTFRTILIAAFAALAVTLLVSFGLHKLRQRGFHLDLPGQLGVDITQTANGFTYSKSQGGHTIFTIHASRIVQFKNDQAELHDVAITLFGPAGSHRADKITGKDFLYNKATGKVIAKGPVEIDMASPTTSAATSAADTIADTIHVQTSDLEFDQQTEEAQTAQPLTFTLPRAQGKSVGGDYNAKTGVLILQSSVLLRADPGSGQNGSPPVVHAEHAQLLRDSHIAYLLHATSEYQGGQDSADQAILHFRPDGSIASLDAQDHVHMVTADGAELYASRATADFDAHSQPLAAHAGGGVNFVSDTPASTMHGNAVNGTMTFTTGPDGKATLKHAKFRNAVSFVLQENSVGGDPRGSATREMTASALDVDFAPGPGGKSVAQKAVAQGGAMVNLHDLPYGAPPRQTTIRGEQLIALLTGGHELQQLDGSGGTSVNDISPNGATQTSTGDQLHVTFLKTAAVQSAPRESTVRNVPGSTSNSSTMGFGPSESAQVDTAVQQGHVTLVSVPARGARQIDGTPQQPLYAEAAVGTYHAANQTLTLTGDAQTTPRMHNTAIALTAKRIDYRRDTGDAVAHDDVRSTYLQGKPVKGAHAAPGLGGAGAVHVVAASAVMTRSTSLAVFEGDGSAQARMWQGANSVAAPVLELGKQQGSLNAHGAPDGHGANASAGGNLVHAAFTGSALGKAAGDGAGNVAGGASKPLAAGSVTRVQSDRLFYSDTTRLADFTGEVVLQQPDGMVRAKDAQVFLSEAAPGQASQLDRMIATGDVTLTQPGRKGQGQKLVYTADNGEYVLTGVPGQPPRATDAAHGATTGAALVFKSGSDSVEVMSHDEQGNSLRTVTDTRTPK